MARPLTPDAVPVLSRGKHRNSTKGACFMEYASFLAGERWSDHPECTHSLLAGVARGVNDYTSDAARSRLIGWIPSVIGLNGDEPAVDAGIAIRCAAIALPVVSQSRQRALATGLLAAVRFLQEADNERLSATDTSRLVDHAERALSRVPHARRWAEHFVADTELTARALQRRSAPAIVRVAIVGIAEACIPDPDGLLYELLATVIDDCTRWFGSGQSAGPAVASSRLPMRRTDVYGLGPPSTGVTVT